MTSSSDARYNAIVIKYMYSAYTLTSNPIAPVSWSTEAFNVTPSASGIICDRLSTWFNTTLSLPDGSVPNTHTVGGWLQGRTVMVTMLRRLWITGLVTLQ